MTIQEVINAIAGALNGIDNTKKIYTEHSEQSFDTPCFYIHTIGGRKSHLTGNFRRRSLQFDIQLYPEINGSERTQCVAAADDLLELLEYVTVEETPLKIVSPDYEIVDNILHFTIGINANVEIQVTPDDDMQTLEQQSGTKG